MMLLRLALLLCWLVFCLSSLPVDWMEKGGHHVSSFNIRLSSHMDCCSHTFGKAFSQLKPPPPPPAIDYIKCVCVRIMLLTTWSSLADSLSQWVSDSIHEKRAALTQVTSSMLFRNSELCNQSAYSYFQNENEWEFTSLYTFYSYFTECYLRL